MIFTTHIHGIPCQCKVTRVTSYRPMVIHGSGFGDAHPPEPVEFEYEILDRKGYAADWLARHITPSTETRLLEEYRVMKDAEYYEPA